MGGADKKDTPITSVPHRKRMNKYEAALYSTKCDSVDRDDNIHTKQRHKDVYLTFRADVVVVVCQN